MSEDSGGGVSAADTDVPAPQKPASVWEDFIDIFYAPSVVFARRAQAGFGIPMLVVTVLIGGIFLASFSAMQPVMDAEFTRSMAQAMKTNPNLTPEMAEKMRGFGESFAKIGAFVFMPVGIFLTGLVLWGLGKLVDAATTFGQALMVASYSFVPRVAESVLNALQVLLMDPSSLNGRLRLTLGVGRFLDPDTTSPLLLAVVGRLDVFTIWVTLLLVIGLSVTGKIPRSKAALIAVPMWLAGGLAAILGALRNG